MSTRLRTRAWSKPAERIGGDVHEESKGCEIELCGSEALNDAHGCASVTGTVPEVVVRRRGQRQRLTALGGEQGPRARGSSCLR